ncbi:hypothetical protein [Devosia sp. FKR38]|uniref:hypothetical protein n=1 Tax=Devosia sp. FKR38 TaxID=2562312 RepID=UPI0010C067CD|nr:hypothetical protein [Devosia sp. FKR38]
MQSFAKIASPAIVAFAVIVSAGAAFAAPTFTTANPGSGMAIADFRSQLGVFNPSEVTELVGAKTVSVIKYDTAWSKDDDTAKAVDLLTTDAQSIGQLREAIKANAEAAKLLEANHIAINDVVDLVSDGAGNVSIYVS